MNLKDKICASFSSSTLTCSLLHIMLRLAGNRGDGDVEVNLPHVDHDERRRVEPVGLAGAVDGAGPQGHPN